VVRCCTSIWSSKVPCCTTLWSKAGPQRSPESHPLVVQSCTTCGPRLDLSVVRCRTPLWSKVAPPVVQGWTPVWSGVAPPCCPMLHHLWLWSKAGPQRGPVSHPLVVRSCTTCGPRLDLSVVQCRTPLWSDEVRRWTSCSPESDYPLVQCQTYVMTLTFTEYCGHSYSTLVSQESLRLNYWEKRRFNTSVSRESMPPYLTAVSGLVNQTTTDDESLRDDGRKKTD